MARDARLFLAPVTFAPLAPVHCRRGGSPVSQSEHCKYPVASCRQRLRFALNVVVVTKPAAPAYGRQCTAPPKHISSGPGVAPKVPWRTRVLGTGTTAFLAQYPLSHCFYAKTIGSHAFLTALKPAKVHAVSGVCKRRELARRSLATAAGPIAAPMVHMRLRALLCAALVGVIARWAVSDPSAPHLQLSSLPATG